MEKEQLTSNGAGQEDNGRKGEKQQTAPQVKEEIEGITALERVQVVEDRKEQAESS